jgi:hypothetical protein
VTNIFLILGLLNKQVNNYGQIDIIFIIIGGRVLERIPAFSTIDLEEMTVGEPFDIRRRRNCAQVERREATGLVQMSNILK